MPLTEPVYIVSVVRDYEMYDRCVRNNPFCQGFQLFPLDNRTENLPVPVRYNQFLDREEEDGWIVFCHEDWRLDCCLPPLLEGLDRSRLYGPIGMWLIECPHSDFMEVRGFTVDGPKDGSRSNRFRGVRLRGRVDTFDCQCLVVHSSLIRRYGLRFDERLAFDLYVEDFCVGAYERYGIESHILLMECHHFSQGSVGHRFYEALACLQEKYRSARKRYASIVGRHITFGRNTDKPVYNMHRTLGAMIRYLIKK